MKKVSKVMGHLTEGQILERIKETKGFWRVQQLLAIRFALIQPCSAQEVAIFVGLKKQTIHNLFSRYNRFGEKALNTTGKGMARGNSYLSLEEESNFLRPFFEEAARGKIPSAKKIKVALERRLGRSVHKTTVYRILKRNGWRKIVPRPSHPNSDPEQRETFKKTFRLK